MLHLLRTHIVLFALATTPSAFASAFVTRTSISDTLNDPSLRSGKGVPIPLISATTGSGVQPASTVSQGARFLVQGGLHGDEGLTSEFVTWLASRVADGQSLLNDLPPQTMIDFVPFANPDSYRKSRYNAAGVNLNRNFGILWGISREPNGQSAFSEPETRAIRELMAARRYTAAVDVHGFVNWIVMPSPGKALAEATPEKSRLLERWVEAAARLLPMLGVYELKDAANLGDGGAFEDWAFWGNDTLAICLEMQSRQRIVALNGQNEDTFLTYEAFIFNMFSEALTLTKGKAPVEASTKALTADAH